MCNENLFSYHKKNFSKRPLILLEVMIAFALVVLCVLPLIYPQVFILKSERQFLDTIDLDHTVNLLYGNRLQKLYLNEIPWEEIESEKRISISKEMMQESGITSELPFKGEYQFFIIKRKPPKPEDHLYLARLIFSFTSTKNITKKVQIANESEPKKLTYAYDIFIERRPKRINEEEVVNEKNKEGSLETS